MSTYIVVIGASVDLIFLMNAAMVTSSPLSDAVDSQFVCHFAEVLELLVSHQIDISPKDLIGLSPQAIKICGNGRRIIYRVNAKA